ncbi:polygalacturonase inhibitor-like [Iris pallida]|uniref:Polygalacturonase inhibitor-like n=1 Tax=Iris pallida TaxID=29817 RepID=A0AAX6GV07_IRIPA|nr:polygalacturonase inhibitor-like [Iris pallida]
MYRNGTRPKELGDGAVSWLSTRSRSACSMPLSSLLKRVDGMVPVSLLCVNETLLRLARSPREGGRAPERLQ